jgi:hypothetical protein
MQAVISFLAELAAQLSGVTSMIGALLAGLLAAGLWLLYWHHRRKKEGKPGVEATHLIIASLAAIIIFGAAALIGFVWYVKQQNASTADLQQQFSTLQKELDDYVRPRTLTDQQRDTIIRFLLDRKPPEAVHILFHYPDDEAQNYAAQLNFALIKADWKTTSHGAVPANLPTQDRTIIKVGITFFVEYTPTHRENSRALRLLEDAFREAGVQTRGMGSWTNPEGKEMKLYMCVGPRPRR